MIDKLLLLSGNTIPFRQAQAVVNQPKIKDIAFLGQETFFKGCQYLNLSKKRLKVKDKALLENTNDFKILMTTVNDKEAVVEQVKICIQLVLILIFPGYTTSFLPMSIMLSKKTEDGNIERFFIDESNYQNFKEIIRNIFCLQYFTSQTSSQYNPGGPQAQALVQKFRKRREKLAQLKNQQKKESISILSQYASILAVGLNKNINDLMDYTVYQLVDEFRRYKAKVRFDINLSCRLAGASDVEQVSNWMSNEYLQDD